MNTYQKGQYAQILNAYIMELGVDASMDEIVQFFDRLLKESVEKEEYEKAQILKDKIVELRQQKR
jgi:protein-arginine kinase activator protein McsA